MNTRKGEAEGRAASLQGREVNAIAGVAACAVGAMTSLLLLVIVYTDVTTPNDGRSHLAEIINDNRNKLQPVKTPLRAVCRLVKLSDVVAGEGCRGPFISILPLKFWAVGKLLKNFSFFVNFMFKNAKLGLTDPHFCEIMRQSYNYEHS